MNTLEVKGDWIITKGKLKQKWAKLTDDDLQYAEGKQEELIGRIQKRTGETREDTETETKEKRQAGGEEQQQRRQNAEEAKTAKRHAQTRDHAGGGEAG